MNILFIYEYTNKSGLGHRTRSAALQEVFRSKGANCYSISTTFQSLKNNYKKFNSNIISFIKKKKIKLLVKDSNLLNYKWEKNISKYTKLLVISDSRFKKHFCDIYVNYHFNYFRKRDFKNLKNKNCLKLIGSKYTIIKKLKIKKNFKYKKPEIFVYMGGVDRKKIMFKLIKIFNKNIFGKYKKTYLLNTTHLKKIKILNFKTKKNIKFLSGNNHNLANYFKNSYLSVTGGGMSMYEQLILAPRSIVIPQNTLQSSFLKNFKSKYFQNMICPLNLLTKRKIFEILNKKRSSKKDISKFKDGKFLIYKKVKKYLN